MRLLLASVLLALVSGLAAQSVVIEVDRPVTGHFWALGPLPLDTPPILVGEGGVRAYRIQAIGQHSAIYGLESFAELLPRDGVVKLEPAASGDPVALWWAHPAVLDDLGAVAGAARVGGVWSPSPRIALEVDGEHRKRFSCEHRCGDYAVRLWFDVFARSPVVQVVGFIARLDRRPELGVEVELAFGEEIAFPWERLHGGRLRLKDGAIRGDVDLDHGAVYPLRFTLLCSRSPSRTGEVAADAGLLDDLDAAARKAGAAGARWFSPRAWPAVWLGVLPPVDTAAGQDLAGRGLASFLSAHRMSDLRPWASMPGASQGGAQNSLALSWFAPAFVGVELRPHDVHLWSAEDWALRPMHVLEPGTTEPVGDIRSFGGTVAARQVFERGLDIGGQHYPRFGTRGVVPVHLPSGNRDVRSTPDELHTADLPLVAAFAMTGAPLCGWLLESCRAIDLGHRQVSSGWRSNGRGEGRTGVSMLMNAQAFGGRPLELVVEHLRLRLATAVERADSRDFPADAVSRPVELYDDRRLSCQAPAIIVYEEAQIAWHCWLLYRQTGDVAALDGAYRWGLTAAATLHEVDSAWRVPYACTQLPDGAPLSQEQLRDPTYSHPSTWPILWSACGLRALVLSAELRQVPEEHRAFVARARAALRWVDAQPVSKVEEIHQGLVGADVRPMEVR